MASAEGAYNARHAWNLYITISAFGNLIRENFITFRLGWGQSRPKKMCSYKGKILWIVYRLGQKLTLVSHSNTALRKYVATVIQVLDLPDYQKEWVARFLGHTLKVHAEFYRLDPVVVNLAKMSKIMLLVDQGKVREAEGLDINKLDSFDLTRDDVFDDEQVT
jgi:hypothetical protein